MKLRDLKRICDAHANIGCDSCPHSDACSNKPYQLSNDDLIEIESKCEKWLREHPVITRKNAFLRLFPHAKINPDAATANAPCLEIAPCLLDIRVECIKDCQKCRYDYWFAEVEDNVK